MTDQQRLQVAIPVFNRITALDAIGPYDVLQRIPWVDIAFIGSTRDSVRTDNGYLGIEVDATYEDVTQPDIIVFPGGFGTRALIRDAAVLEWLRHAHQTTMFTTSVCTGSLVLAAAGLLDGLEATTHWKSLDYLGELGAIPTSRRVVEHLDQRIITSAGVSSGIDMALRLVELLVDRTAAEGIQLYIEYDPQPPFDAGSPAKASDEVKARAADYVAEREAMNKARLAAAGS